MVVLSNKHTVLPQTHSFFFFLMALMGAMDPRDPHSGFDPAGSVSCRLKVVPAGTCCSRCLRVSCAPGALLQTDFWRRDVPPRQHSCHLLQFQSSVSRWKGL